MTKAPFLLGRANGVPSRRSSQKHANEKEIGEGIDEVTGAIAELMHWPKAERENRLNMLAEQIRMVQSATSNLNAKEQLKRVEASNKLVELLRRVSHEL